MYPAVWWDGHTIAASARGRRLTCDTLAAGRATLRASRASTVVWSALASHMVQATPCSTTISRKRSNIGFIDETELQDRRNKKGEGRKMHGGRGTTGGPPI